MNNKERLEMSRSLLFGGLFERVIGKGMRKVVSSRGIPRILPTGLGSIYMS